ncbi:TPM domain-containing protein [Oxalobacteraceae bacterium R-40]|uniref:TPM domain-containing protein n=1 Tax=Keguizhuia sedimenti TaxID=3064264 RepID=A0ABU1BLW5_9BURK|nr:TPM domain-containing protein [Oxalobacteraceae bacterium R-40]
MTVFRILAAWLLASVVMLAGAQNLATVPPLQARVTDNAGMLQPQQRAALENVLADYEQRTGSQIAILLVNSTAPEAIEQYSIRVADAWKIGRKGVDDGVIVVIAKDNPPALRRMRIEAGRGVQGSLTDAQSKRILQDVMAPHFRQNDFYGGLAAGISAIANLLDKEQFPAPKQAQGQQQEDGGFFSLLPFIFFIFILISMMRSRSRASRRVFNNHGWGRNRGIILGSGIGYGGFGGFGGGGGGFGGGGFGGGGGGFDGGGASGNW